jgi:hypothetical protein
MERDLQYLHARVQHIEDYISYMSTRKHKQNDTSVVHNKRHKNDSEVINMEVDYDTNVSTVTIPKVIYTFWDNLPLPPFVQKCINTWKYHNPLYKVVVITKNDLAKYKISQNIINWVPYPQTLSDFVRLTVLSVNGGVWCDASIMMTRSLDWIHETQKGFVGFYRKTAASSRNSPYPVIESWFFACTPRNRFVQMWLQEFSRTVQFPSLNDYVNDCVTNGHVDIQKIALLAPLREDNLGQSYREVGYLAVYVSAQVIIQRMNPGELEATTEVLTAEDGPLYYLETSNWYFIKSINYLLNKDPNMKKRGVDLLYPTWNMIKFTGQSRDALIDMSNKLGEKPTIEKIYRMAIQQSQTGVLAA